MPFGKNKKLTMPRAKKAKVEHEDRPPLVAIESGVAQERSASTTSSESSAQPPSPGQEAREEADEAFDEAVQEWDYARKRLREAEGMLKAERLLFSRKVERIGKGEERKVKPSGVMVMDRAYQAHISLLERQLAASDARAGEAEASSRVRMCEVHIHELEIARLRRRLRAR